MESRAPCLRRDSNMGARAGVWGPPHPVLPVRLPTSSRGPRRALWDGGAMWVLMEAQEVGSNVGTAPQKGLPQRSSEPRKVRLKKNLLCLIFFFFFLEKGLNVSRSI